MLKCVQVHEWRWEGPSVTFAEQTDAEQGERERVHSRPGPPFARRFGYIGSFARVQSSPTKSGTFDLFFVVLFLVILKCCWVLLHVFDYCSTVNYNFCRAEVFLTWFLLLEISSNDVCLITQPRIWCQFLFQTNVIEAGPSMGREGSKEWYYSDKDGQRQGPFSFDEVFLWISFYFWRIFSGSQNLSSPLDHSRVFLRFSVPKRFQLKQLYSDKVVWEKTQVWAQGLDGWLTLSAVPQLRWSLAFTGANTIFDYSQLSILVLDTFIRMCQFFPSRYSSLHSVYYSVLWYRKNWSFNPSQCISLNLHWTSDSNNETLNFKLENGGILRDADGCVVRPVPAVKKSLSQANCLPHIVQLLLTFEPSIVERVSQLLFLIMQVHFFGVISNS